MCNTPATFIRVYTSATDSSVTNEDAVGDHDDKSFKTKCVPALVLLTGFEMHLVLRQCLEAQNVPSDKVEQVLKGVIQVFLGVAEQSFRIRRWSHIDDPTTGRSVSSLEALKQAMAQVVNSSIVSLNERSMDRLFDLMLMGAKRHVFYAEGSAWICEIIHEQLDWLASLLSEDSEANEASQLVVQSLKAQLSRFYQDQYEGSETLFEDLSRILAVKRIEISLLLQAGIQADDGFFKADASSEAKFKLNMYGKEDGPSHAERLERRRKKLQKDSHRSPGPLVLGVELKDNATYENEVGSGQQHGQVTLHYPNGDMYVGLLAKELPHGHGILYYADGSEWHGTWLHGHKHGVGVHIWANGDREEGEWDNGEKLALGVRRKGIATKGSGNLDDLMVENFDSTSLFNVVVEGEDDGADVKEEKLAPLRRQKASQLPLEIDF